MEKMSMKTNRIITVVLSMLYVVATLAIPYFSHSYPNVDTFGKITKQNDYMSLLDSFSNQVGGGILIFFLVPVFLCVIAALLIAILNNRNSYVFSLIAGCVAAIHSLTVFIVFDSIVKKLNYFTDIEQILLGEKDNSLKLSFGFYIALVCALALIVFSILALKNAGETTLERKNPYVKTENPSVPTPAPIATPAAVHSIVCVSGEFASANFPLNPNETITIGRDSSVSNIVIVAPKISRKHCTIRFNSTSNMFEVTDCSSNGTFQANGSRLIANMITPLPAGTVLSLGSNENQFRLV